MGVGGEREPDEIWRAEQHSATHGTSVETDEDVQKGARQARMKYGGSTSGSALGRLLGALSSLVCSSSLIVLVVSFVVVVVVADSGKAGPAAAKKSDELIAHMLDGLSS